MKVFRTLELAVEFSNAVKRLRIEGHLRDQLLRAASSIALNLAEGNAKFSEKEKKRFYKIAYGSLKECQVALRLLDVTVPQLSQQADHLGASLYRLIGSKIIQERSGVWTPSAVSNTAPES
jgi:four helix bundle protein